MKYLLIPVLFFLGCDTMKVDQIRFGAGHADLSAKAKVATITDKGDGRATFGQVELVNRVTNDVSAGLLLGYGSGDIEDVRTTRYDVGGIARKYLTDGEVVRPYFSGRLGYRRLEVDDDFLGRGHSDMLTIGAGLGLEVKVTRGFSLFGDVTYEGAFGDDFSTHGPVLTVGGVISF